MCTNTLEGSMKDLSGSNLKTECRCFPVALVSDCPYIFPKSYTPKITQ